MRQGLGVLLAILMICAAAGTARADALAQWLEAVGACTGRQELVLAVIGFDEAQQVLSREQADEVRLAVESRLQAAGRIRLAAAADVVRLKALKDSLRAQTAEEGEAQVRRAFAGDATVFFIAPERNGDKARFRLQAIVGTGDCKAVSEPLESGIRTGPGLVDIDQAMRGAVANLVRLAPDMRRIDLCPVAAASGYSACSAALGERLLLALDAEARSDDRLLRRGPLELRKARPGQCQAGDADVSALGSFEHDQAGRSWMALEFRRKGAVIAPLARSRIQVEALGCDPALRPFLDHVAMTGRTDRNRLAILPAAAPFRKGQRLDIRIEGQAGLRLYCWLLAPDGSAYVVLPLRGAEEQSVVRAGGAPYPYGFGLADIVLNQPFENLFSCFGSEEPLPAALRERWLAAAPSATSDAKLLDRDEVLDLLESLRSVPGVSEAAAPVIVR